MPEKENLEKVIEDRKRIVENVMHRYLGISIKELNEDITTRLNQPFEFIIDTSIPYKKAKKFFIHKYIEKILKKNLGNISEAAKEAGTNRRTIHRLIKEFNIDMKNMRKLLMKPEHVEKDYVNKVIEGTLKKYDDFLHPDKIDQMYKKLPEASESMVQNLPQNSMTLKEAENKFEELYLIQALKENNMDEKKTAKNIGIRYETLHRKLNGLKKKLNEQND